MVTEGEISRDDKVRVVRDGVVIFDGEFGSMRRFKDDVKTVKNGYECGLRIEKFQDIKVGDIFEAYKIVEVAHTVNKEGKREAEQRHSQAWRAAS